MDNKLKRIIITSLILILVIAGGVYYYFYGKTYTLRFSENQIREQLNARLPFTKTYLFFFDVTLDKPRVHLSEGSERIQAGLDVYLNIRIGDEELSLGGKLDASGDVKYVPGKGTFYLTDPEIKRLSVKGIPEKYTEKVNSVLTKAIGEYFADHPIYTLRSSDIKQAATRLILRKVYIKNGELVLILGL